MRGNVNAPPRTFGPGGVPGKSGQDEVPHGAAGWHSTRRRVVRVVLVTFRCVCGFVFVV